MMFFVLRRTVLMLFRLFSLLIIRRFVLSAPLRSSVLLRLPPTGTPDGIRWPPFCCCAFLCPLAGTLGSTLSFAVSSMNSASLNSEKSTGISLRVLRGMLPVCENDDLPSVIVLCCAMWWL
uniref:Putative secreted protein n=1 Tax=Anopheles darlingi TaxID=43151 RepID=A0A2M4DQY3_ANODA